MVEDGELTGKLLVAAPALRDANFLRTVVLILEHNDSGAIGVVLNRPSSTPVSDALPQWQPIAADPAVVFVGGPVQVTAAICLATSDEARVEGWQPLFGPLGTLDLERAPDELGVSIQALRVFAGFASWGPGQLEGEIEAGAWFVVDAAPGDALTDVPRKMWHEVLRRQRGALSQLAGFPLELSHN